jgi:hypothetical protein
MADAFVTRALENGDTRGTEAGDERATNLLEWFGALALVSVSGFVVNSQQSLSGSLAWGAVGGLSAFGSAVLQGGLAWDAAGLMVADGVGAISGTINFTASSTLSADGLIRREGGADWQANSLFAASGMPIKNAALNWAAGGTLTAFGEGGLYGFISYRLGATWVDTAPFVKTATTTRVTEAGHIRVTEEFDTRVRNFAREGDWVEPDRAWVFVSGSWRRFI